jgi:hypothetical protein
MSVDEYLEVMRNPFSTVVANPKVPDGKVFARKGVRNSVIGVVKFDYGNCTLMLQPSYSSPMTVMFPTSATADLNSLLHFSDSGHSFVFDDVAHTCTRNSYGPDKWRLVSAGLRVTLTQISSENDGWFEAIRYNPTFSPAGYYIERGATTSLPTTCGRILRGTGFLTGSWEGDPSYMTGKLRDIENYMFYLQCGDERKFVRFPDSWEEVAVSDGTTNDFYCQANSLTPGIMNDKAFDVVLVRCHSEVETSTFTNILTHTVHNFEEVHVPPGLVAKFQTGSCNAPYRVQEQDREIKKDIRPGID